MSEYNYSFVSHSQASKNEKELLHDFFQMRSDVFKEVWDTDYYDDLATDKDLAKYTYFLLATDSKGDLLGGTRLVVHSPNSNVKLPMENESERHPISKVLPHLETSGMCYAELGSIAVNHEHRGKGVAKELIKKSFQQATQHFPLDCMFTSANRRSIKLIINSANEAGHKSYVRKDTNIRIRKKLFPRDLNIEKSYFTMIHSNNTDFCFAPEIDERRGQVMEANKYLAEEKTRQR